MPIERTLSLTEPVASVRDYVRAGGGEGLAKAQRARPESVIDTIEAAGLRGRGRRRFPNRGQSGGRDDGLERRAWHRRS